MSIQRGRLGLVGLAILVAVSAHAGDSNEVKSDPMIDASEKSGEPIWTWPLALTGTAPRTIIVEGVRENGMFKPQRANIPQSEESAPPRRPLLAFRADILPGASLRAFGVEERIEIAAGKETVIICRTGKHPGGVAISFNGRFPQQAAFDVAIDGRLEKAHLALVHNGGDVSNASDRIAFQEQGMLSVPAGVVTQDAELVLVCPEDDVSIELRSITLVPNIGSGETTDGTWIWDADHWLDRPAALIEALRDAGIDEIYLQLPLDDRSHLDEWRDFLSRLHDAGIRIVAVEGDPEMVLSDGRRHALARAARLAAFRRDHPGLIIGVQYDVEPYLLDSHAADPKESWNAWGGLLRDLHDALDTRVSAVVPFWMINDAAAGPALTMAADHVEDYVIMAYRTDASEIERLSTPWLEFASPAAVGIRISLENGPLAVEYHRAYRQGQSGEAALVDLSGSPTLELYDETVSANPEQTTYAFSHEVASDPRRVTFAGESVRLKTVGNSIRERLAAWPSFRGLAFHELIGISESESHGGSDTRKR